MPFDSKTGAIAGRKGNSIRWKDKDPITVRSEKILFKASPGEKAEIDENAKKAGMSRGEFIISRCTKCIQVEYQ